MTAINDLYKNIPIAPVETIYFITIYLIMSYPIVTSVPEGSEWLGDDKATIQDGYINTWGYQASYGRQIIVSFYSTPKGEIVLLEKYKTNGITKDELQESFRAAGY